MSISPTNPGGLGVPSTAVSSLAALPATSTSSIKPAALVEMPTKAVQSADAVSKFSRIKDSVDQLNKAVQILAKDVRFMVDDETGIHVVKVMDINTQEVIRQYPSEEILSLAKSLDKLQGFLIRQKA